MGGQILQPQMSAQQAAEGAGLTLDPMSKMYVDSKGQFYSVPTQQVSPLQNILMGGMFPQNPMFNRQKQDGLNYGGYMFNRFTGDAPGITAGVRSMVDRMTKNQQEPVVQDILGQFFPAEMPTNTQSSGAGRFLQGLLK